MCVSIPGMITSHVREVAEKRGIRNAHQLAQKAKVPANLAVRVWNDDFERVDRSTLNKLCSALKCQPGMLLKFAED